MAKPLPQYAPQYAPTAPPSTRSCGECQVCCEVLAVYPNNDLDALPMTREFERCQFQAPGCCLVYKHRPSPCAAYHCMWRLGWGTDAARPDRLGIVVEASSQGWLIVLESRPGGWHEPLAQAVIQACREAEVNPATAVHITPWGKSPSEGWWDGPPPSHEKIMQVAIEMSLQNEREKAQ